MHIRRGYVLAGMGVTFPLLIALQVNLLKHVSDPTAKQVFANLVNLQMYVMVTCILVAVHYYLYKKLISATFIHKDHPKALYIFLLVSALSTLSFFLSKVLAAPETPFLVHLAFTSFAWSFLTVFSLWVADFLFWFGDFFRSRSAAVISEISKARRKALLALAISSLMVTLGALSAAEEPAIIRTEVRLARFPCEMNGFTIVQISDTHLGNTFPRAKFVEIVNRINALKPDLVALTGDLVDAKMKPSLLPILEPLGWLNAKHGIYYVTGNHEYMTGSAVEWMEELQKKNIHVLHNSHEVIATEKGSFIIAGVDDIAGGMVHGHGPQFDSALANIDKTKEVILLAHQPLLVSEAAPRDIGLVLSGHTHGGQIWPFGYLVKIAQPYLEGLHTHIQGNSQTQIYVSRGTGWWGPPIRLFAPAEISHHTLFCKNV